MSAFYYVHDASTTRHGIMVCAGCGKPIDKGQYRVKDTPDAYINHHRDCVPHDPKWAEFDAEAAERKRNKEMLLADAEAFRNRWSVDDLDDLIGSLTEQLAKAAQ